MSDSDEDWFEKDFDEIAEKVQKKKDEINLNADLENASLTERRIPNFLLAEDYGGNYEQPKSRNDKNPNQNKSKTTKSEKGFIQTISYKKLTFISDLSSLNIFMEITQNDCGFFEALNENLSNEYLFLFIKVLSKLCELPLIEFKMEFLKNFIQSQTFLKQLESLVKDLLTNKTIKKKKSIFQLSPDELLQNILCISKDIERFELVNEYFKNLIKNILKQLNESTGKFLKIKDEFIEIDKLLQEDKISTISKDIYPTLEELNCCIETEDLKPNIIQGKYESIKHYLDIHLSLLREDFISPLRDTIIDLKSSENLKQSSKRVYKKVRFLLNDIINSKTRKGEMLMVDLKPDQRNDISSSSNPENSWVNPKKLMFGSLLCFTTDMKFENLILAVVSNRDIDTILKGYIQIEIIKIYNVSNIFDIDFVMLESEVYFEPYHHVYRVLKSLDETTFPMRNFIVDCEKTNQPPDYLLNSPNNSYEYKKYSFNPLKPETYPSEKILNLDSSQFEGFWKSLSQKFSLIQGPPGTGKTYIGLKIVSTLLRNVDQQIIVICYTNHALDQFLLGISNITTDIVRMGNQSKHEQLDKYNIKQMTETTVTDRRLKTCFYNMKTEYTKRFHEFEELQKNFDKSEENYKKILSIQVALRTISKKLEELKQISEYNFIKDKKVIGMTTTCAARCHLLLQLLKTPIVIVEEAAEVLESHIIASLTQETQHLILIGDHQQLRPTTSVYKLSEKYKMDISLFERMINNKLNSVCLNTQHRMREEIANLIRPTIYKNLEDHEIVKNYENIRGVSRNMFFINHNLPESKFTEETTKRNIHEAQYLVRLANYLLMQSYKAEDIVIVATYIGQLIQLLNERKQYPNTQKVRITVVDNFQGEESKIILLSLVRSNDENRIGFLSMKNRICVALSRAREGFYVIGNMNFLAKNNSIWNEIKEKLETTNSIGEELPLQCQRHQVLMNIKNPNDFELVKYGGCQQRCDYELPCGHTCGYMCHWNGFEHSANCECS